MIIYHVTYDLKNTFIEFETVLPDLYWDKFPGLIGAMFFFAMGYSMQFSQKSQFMRGLKIFGLGVAVSVVSYLYDVRLIILFGVLHGLGVSMILLPFFKKFKWTNFYLSLAIIVIGTVLYYYKFDVKYLFIFNICEPGFISRDFYPLFPWFGFSLLGLFCAQEYSSTVQSISDKISPNKTIEWLSSHSLAIYIVHQPLIIFIITLVAKFSRK